MAETRNEAQHIAMARVLTTAGVAFPTGASFNDLLDLVVKRWVGATYSGEYWLYYRVATANGYSPPSLTTTNDMIMQTAATLGVTGSINDVLFKFWNNDALVNATFPP